MTVLLDDAARRAARYLGQLGERPVFPRTIDLEPLGGLLPAESQDPADVLRLLDDVGSPATVASAGGRYFGFVTGGCMPAALAAGWLASAWDQNAALWVMSPVAQALERTVIRWLSALFGFGPDTEGVLVTGTTMANAAGLAAARQAVLERLGWDAASQGLFGAPPVRVVVGDEVHASLFKALALVGLGRDRVERVPVDGQGRMRPDRLPPLDSSTILCLQAGNVNTGASDPFEPIIAAAREAGAWVHVDGAFGLWAAASPTRAGQVAGVAAADSWATDLHKWLNVSYDCGVLLLRRVDALGASLNGSAPYLDERTARESLHLAPESSRRARAVEAWAALRACGADGVAALVDRCCGHAQRFAAALRQAGWEVLNEVALNQVLVRFGDDDQTRRTIAGVQNDGTCWAGGTIWQGKAAMRISVSSWATTEADVTASIEAICRIAAREAGRRGIEGSGGRGEPPADPTEPK